MSVNFHEVIATRLAQSCCRVIVTGAGGWLGRATLEMLDAALGPAFERRVIAIASQSRVIKLGSGRTLPVIDFDAARKISAAPTIMAHYAFLTRDKVSMSSLSQYVETNRVITSAAIELAERLKMDGIFLVSSGAVYEDFKTIGGDLDTNPYGFLKREEEISFLRHAEGQNCRLSLCRLFNLSGPYIYKEFALKAILLSILEKRNIELSANRKVVRDFIHVRDLVSLGFAMMLDERQYHYEAFDSGIGQPIEIGDLARRSIELLRARDLTILRGKLENEPNIYIGDPNKILSLAKYYDLPFSSIDAQILDTFNYLQSAQSEAILLS